ncbi:hypothetical protein [Streptomyces sp. NPDC088785]|uniref:hypothetical protein n=1 Tax=Streptomyces sp. NPDC088785 TaxID=3365897 RepID=UPI00382F922D
MIFSSKSTSEPELNVLVLRDAERIAEAVDAALAQAGEADRPGLERAAAVVAGFVAEGAVGVWVRERLAAAGYEGPVDAVRAVRILREAEPSLSLLTATRLARQAAR